ncbi:hypothetical protein BDV39DRAFT_193962 [Aspergillus sergii]|uniref:Aminoglycoside phosphotransferase domain-containing protein n=1 Tax=Aspergillus sergii TaxID=1034303 RepID=A0A5N6WYJ8_9EURO|nr:hypothetical protein BDV39DRAFT_193962 [Aspergillus sergii]
MQTRIEIISDAWVAELFKTDTLRAIGNFIVKHRKGTPIELSRSHLVPQGKRVYFEPCPVYPTLRTKNESPLNLGPFILMDYIDHDTDLGKALNTPTLNIEDHPLADILLHLSQLSLPRIGSLAQIDDFTWEVRRRPLSIGMNELVRLGTLPRSTLPTTTLETTSSYFNALAESHLEHLSHQRNDAVDSANDCRRKFVSRKLFSELAREGRLTQSTNDHGPFTTWCDELRPLNAMVNKSLQIVGAIDWEFTYAAPVEFSHAPPWWLVLEQPEYWPDGIDAWTKAFETRLQTFLEVLTEREDIAMQQGRQSWVNGDFWVTYAARKNYAFNTIFWKKLDHLFFGACTVAEEMSEEERHCMELVVRQKLEQIGKRALAWEPE